LGHNPEIIGISKVGGSLHYDPTIITEPKTFTMQIISAIFSESVRREGSKEELFYKDLSLSSKKSNIIPQKRQSVGRK
jgi:hypothetical protein